MVFGLIVGEELFGGMGVAFAVIVELLVAFGVVGEEVVAIVVGEVW